MYFLWTLIYHIYEQIFSYLFFYKLITAYCLLVYSQNNITVSKSTYLFVFLIIVVLMMFFFDVTSYFGFLIFTEIISILLINVIVVVFFNFFSINKKYVLFFLCLLSLNYLDPVLSTPFDFFSDFFYIYNLNLINDFTSIYAYMYILNVVLTNVFIIFFLIIFFVIVWFFVKISQRYKDLKKKKSNINKTYKGKNNINMFK